MIEVIFNYVLESVETALKANGCKFKGKEITVQRARMQKKKIIIKWLNFKILIFVFDFIFINFYIY